MTVTTDTEHRAPLSRLLPASRTGRALTATSLLGSIGLGLYQAGSAIYFVRFVGLSATSVGSGLALAGLVGLVAGVAVGRLADRFGARKVAIIAALAKAAPLAAVPWADRYWIFLVFVTLLGLAESAWVVANEAIIAHAVSGASRIRLSAVLRSVFNIGLTVGSLAAGLALVAGTKTAYLALFAAYAVTALLEALICLWIPAVPARKPQPSAPRTGRALRDLPYMTVAMHSNLTSLGDVILIVGIPLWIISGTRAPDAVVAWLIALNAVLVVCLQIWAATKAETVRAAVRVQSWALSAFVACCALIALAGATPRWPAIMLLVAGALALTAGEIWGQAARWSLRFSLAPADAQAEYGASFRLGLLLPRALGPLLVTAVVSVGEAGWLALGLLFAAGMAVNRPLGTWAVRTRSHEVPS